ncbi:hypothetical protein Tco_1183900 [Tanacetum coccineum]
MGRDTIQLEDAVSTISQEYLLEFTSEYGIPESLHPERENIPHRRGMAHKRPKGWDAISRLLFRSGHMDLFNLISALNHTKVKTETRPRTAYEVPLLTTIASRVIDMEDTTMASGSSGTPSALEKSPLDFDNENPPPLITERDGMEDQV